MPLWFCEFRTTVSGKVEAETESEARRKFTEAIDALDLGAGDIQDFRLERARSGYATEVDELETQDKRKQHKRAIPPWRQQ